jgi:alkyldihydroxyacetonephosphate synthase
VDTRWQKERFHAGYRRDTLLDRGAAMDSLVLSANWSKLALLYVTVRNALKQAMRAHAPRAGAHGVVLCHVSAANPEGANLNFTWLFPRILDGGIAQAQSIRQAALAAAQPRQRHTLERDLLRGIKQTLDPSGILNPGLL